MENLYQLPIMKEAETLAPPENESSGIAGVTNPGGSDSTAFIQALTGGSKDVLNNTSGGEKRSQKKKTVDRYSKTWQLMGATESTGIAGGKTTTPGTLTPGFTEFLSTDNTAAKIHLCVAGLVWAKSDMQSKQSLAYYYVDWRDELINAPLTTCIQTASIHSDPLQLCLAVLDKKLCALNFLPVARSNQAYNKMLCSDRTAQLDDQHDESAEDRIAKTKHMFIDGEFD